VEAYCCSGGKSLRPLLRRWLAVGRWPVAAGVNGLWGTVKVTAERSQLRAFTSSYNSRTIFMERGRGNTPPLLWEQGLQTRVQCDIWAAAKRGTIKLASSAAVCPVITYLKSCSTRPPRTRLLMACSTSSRSLCDPRWPRHTNRIEEHHFSQGEPSHVMRMPFALNTMPNSFSYYVRINLPCLGSSTISTISSQHKSQLSDGRAGSLLLSGTSRRISSRSMWMSTRP